VAAGAAVCVTARKGDEVEETVEALRALGGRAAGVIGSASADGAADEAAAHCLAELGSLDILVNNAATSPHYGPMVEAEPAAVSKTFELNQAVPLRFVRAAWETWMADHGGVVLNMASVGGLHVMPGIGIYNVSKAALIHLTRQLAVELAPKVRVNALAPAVIKTSFSRALYEGREESVAAAYPLRRLGTTDDVASAALFFVSDASSWLTGQVLQIDGGVALTSEGG
jgi:NAD(P)-dependent dehydrogenase (short-subunit alcohol dehydrogenase family)